MKKLGGWICDSCGKFFTFDPIIGQGKTRKLQFCRLKCKAEWLKKL